MQQGDRKCPVSQVQQQSKAQQEKAQPVSQTERRRRTRLGQKMQELRLPTRVRTPEV